MRTSPQYSCSARDRDPEIKKIANEQIFHEIIFYPRNTSQVFSTYRVRIISSIKLIQTHTYFHIHILEKSISNMSWENVLQQNFVDSSHRFYLLLLYLQRNRETRTKWNVADSSSEKTRKRALCVAERLVKLSLIHIPCFIFMTWFLYL